MDMHRSRTHSRLRPQQAYPAGLLVRLDENVFQSVGVIRGSTGVTDTEREQVVDDEAAAGWGRYGRRPAVVLALVALIDSVDRGILPGVLTEVQDDLGFSDTQMGALAAAFIVAGFLVAIPAGYYRRTRIIAIVLGSWGVVSAVNGLVHAYWQFLAVRVALGAGETIDNPASSSLLADYYRPAVRGRAFALQRVAPIVGGALGLGLGGLVASTLGWRWAFLIVGGPGSLLALAVWRTPEPERGESDRTLVAGDVPLPGAVGTVAEVAAAQVEAAVPASAEPSERRAGFDAMRSDLRQVIRIRTLRSLIVGTAIGSGALQGMAFWATAFYERHSSLGTGGSAGVVATLIALGALVGTFLAGRLVDAMRERMIGFPMLLAGVALLCGSMLLFVTFLPIPLWLRLPGQTLAVVCIVGGLLPLAVMTTEVVPAALRGAAFSLTFFLASLGGALSPLAVGAIADRFEIVVDGDPKGDLAKAFLIVTPLVTIGALVVLRGRRHVEADVAAAQAAVESAARRPGGA
jgi:MFS family permease